MKNKALRNATVGLIILTFVSKVLGFVRELVISYMYGTSAMSDAYSMANAIAILVITGLAMGIMTAYIPENMAINSLIEKDVFTSNIFNTISVIALFFNFLGFLFTREIVNILGMGFPVKTKEYMYILLRFVLISSIFIFLIYLISGYLNTKQNFYYSGMQLVITNFIVIIVVFFSRNNPMLLGAGYLLSYVVPFFVGIAIIKQYGFKHSWVIDLKCPALRRVAVVSVVAFLGTNVVKLNVMLDRVFATELQEGAVAAINYAFTLTSIIPEVFSLSMITVLYPELSLLYSKKNEVLFGKKVSELVGQTIVLLIPVTVLFVGEGDWIIKFLFQRGAFNEHASFLTTQVLNGYSLGMLPVGMSFILCKVFFARKEKIVPLVCLIASIAMNMLCNIFGQYDDLFELTISTTMSITVTTLAMLFILIKKKAISDVKTLIMSFIKSVVASIIMFLFLFLLKDSATVIFEKSAFLEKFVLLAAISAGTMLVYTLVMLFLGDKFILDFAEKTKNKIKG